MYGSDSHQYEYPRLAYGCWHESDPYIIFSLWAEVHSTPRLLLLFAFCWRRPLVFVRPGSSGYANSSSLRLGTADVPQHAHRPVKWVCVYHAARGPSTPPSRRMPRLLQVAQLAR